MHISIDGPWFKDESGRTLLLRGVNLSGSSKVPRVPDGATYRREGFFEHRNVSFVGRPFPLEEADEHFERLRTWGMTCMRFLVTWEAIEHAGPGLYDDDYLDYVTAVLEKALDYNLQVFVDFHQDVWSRFSGGDGAPGWTLEVAGLDMRHFAPTAAAIVHAVHGDPFPRMIWPTNATKLAAATMFTLFFGGRLFAPQCTVEGENIQDYLQRHYLAAAQRLAQRLAHLPNVIGYDIINEPLPGYIGWPDLSRHNGLLHQGVTPTPFQAMALGEGLAQTVDVFETSILGSRVVRRERIDPQGVRAWREGYTCIWRQHGVWDIDTGDTPRLLRPDYFAQVNGKQVDFGQDCLLPFYRHFVQTVRAVHPQALIFIEPEVNQPPPLWDHDRPEGLVYAPHWYDGLTLYLKRYLPWLAYDNRGRGKVVFWPFIRRNLADQLAESKRHAQDYLGNIPVIIGECGIPFDLDHKRAYHNANFKRHAQAMDRTLRALEDNLLSYT
ncbi:MAG: glycoside hydrolase family 5 protein, partial [Thermanaerothrix sp.]|nr:glycoside hydrolase family 5 protein [Thermanaerothrix sp.]